MKHLFSAVCVALLFTWGLPAAAQNNLSGKVSAQTSRSYAVEHYLRSLDKVFGAATQEQQTVLLNARQQAETFLLQGKYQEALRTLQNIQPVLQNVQARYLETQLEELNLLFMGPSTLEQRAMLRSGMQLLNELKDKGNLDEAIFVAAYLDESFDTPPALSPEQRRDAYYHDALEGLDLLYQLVATDENTPAQKRLQQVYKKYTLMITDTRTNDTLSEENLARAYEDMLNQAEDEFSQVTK